MLCARPTPASSMPPHQTGTPAACATSCTRVASRKPPTRPSLILMTPRAASDLAPERLALQPRLQVPERRLQASPRHLMAPNVVREGSRVRGAPQFGAEHPRRHVIAQDRPGGAGPFLVIKRVLAGRDF